MLIGFDRLLATQKAVLDAWGEWRLDELGEAASSKRFLAAQDSTVEIEACVEWLHGRLERDSESRLMVITTGLRERRGSWNALCWRLGATWNSISSFPWECR